MVIALVAMATLASIVICHWIAASRGGNAVFWGTMGFLFGPLAIPFAFRAKPKRPSVREVGQTPSP